MPECPGGLQGPRARAGPDRALHFRLRCRGLRNQPGASHTVVLEISATSNTTSNAASSYARREPDEAEVVIQTLTIFKANRLVTASQLVGVLHNPMSTARAPLLRRNAPAPPHGHSENVVADSKPLCWYAICKRAAGCAVVQPL